MTRSKYSLIAGDWTDEDEREEAAALLVAVTVVEAKEEWEEEKQALLLEERGGNEQAWSMRAFTTSVCPHAQAMMSGVIPAGRRNEYEKWTPVAIAESFRPSLYLLCSVYGRLDCV